MVVAGNRDEFYDRKTAPAEFWSDYPNVVGGRDLEAMGTWLGMTRSGRISMLTNYRDLATLKPAAPTRGKLVSDFLTSDEDPQRYLEDIAGRGRAYNGFNLIVGDVDRLWYYSNFGDGIKKLEAGSFGLSNHLLDTPWPKVERGRAQFEKILAGDEVAPEDLFALLADEEIAPDAQLPSTGLPVERERALSAMFIKTPDYGSRCSTVILVDRENNASFFERVFDLKTFDYQTQAFRFKVQY